MPWYWASDRPSAFSRRKWGHRRRLIFLRLRIRLTVESDVDCRGSASPVAENPTWLHVVQLANDMIQIYELGERSILEGIQFQKEINGVKQMRFVMAS